MSEAKKNRPAAPGGEANPDVPHHESRRSKRSVRPVRMQLNLTSMIDVIFLLLVYFVVTANFTVDEGVLTANLPGGPTERKEPDTPPTNMDIFLLSDASRSDVQIRLGTRVMSNFTELAKELAAMQFDPDRGRMGSVKPDNPIIIKPQHKVRWQHVVNAFNQAIKERYTNVGFAEAQE